MKVSHAIRRAFVVLAIVGVNVSLIAQTPTPSKPAKKKAPVAKTAPAPVSAKAPEPPPPPPPTDVRLHTNMTTGAQVSETTTLIRGPRQRVEFPGMTVISQCDLNRTLQLNDQSKHFIVQKHQTAEPASSPEGDAALQQAMSGHKPQPPKGGVVTYTTTLTDTGEKKEFFGREARHVKTVTVGESTENACSKVKQRIEVDAWYLDVPSTMAGCTPKAEVKPAAKSADACVDRVETRTVGDAKLGLPVLSTTTTTTGEGVEQDSSAVKIEVDKMEVTRLDPALFDAPADYTEVASYSDLIPSMASGGTLADALLGSVKNGTRQVRPKEAGAIRIGVAEPVNKSQRDISGQRVQDELVGNFKRPYEAVPLFGATPQELQKDAQTKECDHILVATVDEAKTSHPSKAGGFLKAMSGDGPPKDTHEIKMDYKLVDVSAPDKVESASMTKASSGGGFGLKSALKLAAFAGQMYMGFGMNRMMMGQFGGALGATSLMGGGMSGMFNPTMGAMNMVMSGASSMAMSSMMGGAGGGTDMAGMQSDQGFRETMSKALDNVSDGVTAALGKSGQVAKK
jgi:hypothetical protein